MKTVNTMPIKYIARETNQRPGWTDPCPGSGAALPRQRERRKRVPALVMIGLMGVWVGGASADTLTNVGLASFGATASANSEFTAGTAGWTLDNSPRTGWAPLEGVKPWVLTVTLPAQLSVARINLMEGHLHAGSYTTKGKLEYFDGANWQLLTSFEKSEPGIDYTPPMPIVASKVRYTGFSCVAPGGWYNRVPVIEEFQVFTPLPDVNGPADQQVPAGGTAVFKLSIPTDFAVRSCQWYFNGGAIRGETNTSLVLGGATRFYEGEFWARVKLAGAPFGYPVEYESISRQARLSVAELTLQMFAAAELEFPSSVGKTYQIQASRDLIDWQDWGSPIEGTGHLIQQLVSTRSAAHRFFRVKEQ